MAGFYASAIISYGKNKDGELKLMKHLTVPTLRFKPDLTESSFSHNSVSYTHLTLPTNREV